MNCLPDYWTFKRAKLLSSTFQRVGCGRSSLVYDPIITLTLLNQLPKINGLFFHVISRKKNMIFVDAFHELSVTVLA